MHENRRYQKREEFVSSLRLHGQAGARRVRVRLAQHDPVPQQLEQHVIVAEEDEAERQRVVPALGAQQRVQLVQDHARLDPDQQVQDPQWLMEQKLERGKHKQG